MSASRKRIAVLLEKEVREIAASRMLLATSVLVPVVFGAIALSVAWSVGEVAGASPPTPQEVEDLRRLMGSRADAFADPRHAMALYVGEMGLSVVLLLPAVLAPVLSSQTLVREKLSRSLETLLVTPVATWEIVAAKVAFCAGMATAPVHVIAALYYGLLSTRCPGPALEALSSPGWLVVVFVATPLVGVLGVGLGVAVSARVRDTQTAQQLSGMVVLPVLALVVLQSVGLASLDGLGALALIGVLATLDTVVLALAISLFERETVVTRWT